MRLKGKIAIVIGAGQSPGEGMGNGRATVLRFVQEGATVMAVDRDLASAEETVALATKQGGTCVAFEADVTKEKTLAAMVGSARSQFGRIDVRCSRHNRNQLGRGWLGFRWLRLPGLSPPGGQARIFIGIFFWWRTGNLTTKVTDESDLQRESLLFLIG